MKKLLIGAIVLAAVVAMAQETLLYNLTTTVVVVDTNSTVVCTAPNSTVAGAALINYELLENRGTTDVIFAWANKVGTTNVTVDGGAVTMYVGHLLRALDVYECPSQLINIYPIAAISTNANTQGILVITKAFKQP